MTKIDSSLTKEMTKLSTFVTKVRENVSQIEEHQLVQQSPGGTLKISGWGSAAGTLEPLTYTRVSSAEFCYPILE